DLVSPTCDPDELAVSNFLVLDPTLRGLLCTPASAGYNIDVSKFLDLPYFVGDSSLGWRNLFPIYPSFVEEPVKIVFGDRESLPRRPAVQILHVQLCPKLLVGSVAPDEHRLCQDPVQVDSNLQSSACRFGQTDVIPRWREPLTLRITTVRRYVEGDVSTSRNQHAKICPQVQTGPRAR